MTTAISENAATLSDGAEVVKRIFDFMLNPSGTAQQEAPKRDAKQADYISCTFTKCLTPDDLTRPHFCTRAFDKQTGKYAVIAIPLDDLTGLYMSFDEPAERQARLDKAYQAIIKDFELYGQPEEVINVEI